jgi:hypothetical protein
VAGYSIALYHYRVDRGQSCLLFSSLSFSPSFSSVSHTILHLPQRRHNLTRLRLPCHLPHLLGVRPHKRIMPLLIPNREFSLSLLIILREALQFLDILALIHRHQELDVRLRVLVSRVHERIVGELRELREGGLHFRGGAFEELPASADEERVAGEHGAVRGRAGAVDHVVADAVLRVAGGVDRGDGDVLPDGEDLAVLRRRGHERAVLAADDGDAGGEGGEEFFVAARVVVVVVGVEDGGQVYGAAHSFDEGGEDFGGVGRVDDYAVAGGSVGHEVGVVVAGADPCVGC